MVLKVLLFICFVSTTVAIFINPKEKYEPSDWYNNHPIGWRVVQVYHHPNSYGPIHKYEHYTYPKYEFEYMVSDKKTGDHKKHHEARDGDHVRGEYAVVEPNGSLRKVQYQADDLHGFNAVVSKSFNKHGDHAYSSFEHKRYLTPSHGYTVKINHSPKYYSYSKKEDLKVHGGEEKHEKALEEVKVGTDSKDEDKISVELKTQKVLPKDEKVDKIDVSKSTAEEGSGLKSTNTESQETTEVNNTVMTPIIAMIMDKAAIKDNSLAKESLKESNDNTKAPKKEPLSDPEIASSYFHSRIYYMI